MPILVVAPGALGPVSSAGMANISPEEALRFQERRKALLLEDTQATPDDADAAKPE